MPTTPEAVRPPTIVAKIGIAAAIISLGLILAYAAVHSEQLTLPRDGEWLGHLMYRVLFLPALPLLILFGGFGRNGSAILWSLIGIGLVWNAWREWSRCRQKRAAALANNVPALTPRRRFLKRSLQVAGVAAAGLSLDAVAFAPERYRIRRYSVPIEDLPTSLEGLRIVQISDTHYGPFISLRYLREVIRDANNLKPDLIVLTGDYVHQTPRAIHDGIGIFGDLNARLGIVGVLGNHDHWEGAQQCRERFRAVGIPLIDNSRLFLTAKRLSSEMASDSICLAGVGDFWEDRVDIAGALADVPTNVPRLVLSHNPDVAEESLPNKRIDLMLSGHTHGGQVWIPGAGTPRVPSQYGQKYAGGLCEGPRYRVLVSRGVGMAILPVRLGVLPEISEISLEVRG